MNNIGKIFTLGELKSSAAPVGVYGYVEYCGASACIKGDDWNIYFLGYNSLRPSADIETHPNLQVMYLGTLYNLGMDNFTKARFLQVKSEMAPTWTVDIDGVGSVFHDEEQCIAFIRNLHRDVSFTLTKKARA